MKATLLNGKPHGNRARKAGFLCLLAIVAVFLFVGCTFSQNENGVWTPTVSVMVADVDGITVKSENPARIPIGADAVFEIEVADGLVIDKMPDGVVIEDGKMTLSSVFFPRTLRFETHRRTLCDFSAMVAEFGTGTVDATVGNGSHWSETEITVTATPEEGFLFAGFSLGKPVESGGTIISVDSSYTFALSESISIFANFTMEWVDPATTVEVPPDKWVLLYHANGGALTETGMDGIKTQYFSNTYYLCPNTLTDRDYFSREGYVLYGYNTEADGSGTYYGLGWNVVMPERGAISLYCMWAKMSDPKDFTYKVTSSGALTLTKYTGNDEFVVLPDEIDGKRVVSVMSRTFENNTTMKKVMITKNIKTLYDKVFLGCTELSEMYFTDTVTTVGDALLSKCDKFNKIYMLAYINPHYRSSRNGTYAIKYERLITAPGKKLIIASGSNSAYGIDSAQLEGILKRGGHPFSVVNYGQNAGTALTFYCEVISAHMNEGDVLVLAPEINQFQFGYSEINTTLWQIFEGAYNAFSDVDISRYTHFFSSFQTFNNARNQTKFSETAYETYTKDTVNFYGDYSLKKEGYTKDYGNTVKSLLNKGGVGSWTYNSCINHMKNHAAKLNRVLDMVANKGGTVLISFAATNIITMNADSQIAGGKIQTAYEAAVDEYLHGTRISRVATYTMPTEMFYNSHNHLGTAGATERTRRIGNDLLSYFDAVSG